MIELRVERRGLREESSGEQVERAKVDNKRWELREVS
jgi:hypothetical protein